MGVDGLAGALSSDRSSISVDGFRGTPYNRILQQEEERQAAAVKKKKEILNNTEKRHNNHFPENSSHTFKHPAAFQTPQLFLKSPDPFHMRSTYTYLYLNTLLRAIQ